MTKINFKNLPKTDTPISAENLNKLNNVSVGLEQPTLNEELWVEASKNLLSVNDATGSQFLFANLPIYLTPGTYTFTYRTTANEGGTELSLFNNNDIITAVNLTNRTDGKISGAFTLNQNVNQVFLYANGEGRYYDMQIAIGNDDEFEPYNPNKSIKANINGAYETIINKNIYSQNEVIIGEWFGKTLYRKIIDVNINSTQQIEIPHGISDLGNIISIRGYIVNQYYYNMILDCTKSIEIVAGGSMLYINSEWATGLGKLVLEYTKSN